MQSFLQSGEATGLSLRRLSAIGRRLEEDVAAGAIPGASVLVGSQTEVLFERYVGFRNVATRDPVEPDTIWRVYSMTKPIVTTAAMVFVEKGLLRLDQPVADFIPSFAKLRVAQEAGPSVPAKQAPTIQDLMRHTAGLAYGYRGDSPTQQAYAADGLLMEDLSNAEFVERLSALPLEYHPGTTWHYSHATDVLGHVLELISGDDLQGVLQQSLFGPLGMHETCFRLPAEMSNRVAEPLPQAAGASPQFFSPCRDRRRRSAGGGLLSTAGDYCRFLRMLLCNGKLDGNRVLAPATVRLMTADHLGRDIGRAPYYPPGPGYGFGLGFAVRLADGEAAFPGSRGDYFWSGVGGTYFWIDPASGLFVLFLLQTSSPDQRLHYRTLLRNMVYAALE